MCDVMCAWHKSNVTRRGRKPRDGIDYVVAHHTPFFVYPANTSSPRVQTILAVRLRLPLSSPCPAHVQAHVPALVRIDLQEHD